VDQPDTDYCNDSGPTVASRTITIGGRATEMAGRNLMQRLEKVAAEMLGSSLNDIKFANNVFSASGNLKRSVTYREVVERAHDQGISLKETATFTAPRCEYDIKTSQGTTYLQYTYGAVTAEVEVDIETGQVSVLRMVTAYDVGKAINPLSLEGQIDGGTVQGLGYATMEKLIHRNGVVINPNLADYYIPTSLDVPEIKSILVERPGHLGPYGAKAIGEPPVVLPAPAIINAIENAIGVRLDELPATPDRVLKGLKGMVQKQQEA
jgi:CO/xanthine dehydrogenase Mo-binding subunit